MANSLAYNYLPTRLPASQRTKLAKSLQATAQFCYFCGVCEIYLTCCSTNTKEAAFLCCCCQCSFGRHCATATLPAGQGTGVKCSVGKHPLASLFWGICGRTIKTKVNKLLPVQFMLCLLKAQQRPSGTLSALAVVHQDEDQYSIELLLFSLLLPTHADINWDLGLQAREADAEHICLENYNRICALSASHSPSLSLFAFLCLSVVT